jgi:glutamine amidotransferase/cyclase
MAPLAVSLLDYGAGNVRSVRNALSKLGYDVIDVETPEQLRAAEVLVFPGVGSFGSCMAFLEEKGFLKPLREHVLADRPYIGICLGMQTLFEGSEETPDVQGLGVLPGTVRRFAADSGLCVPQIGWNSVSQYKRSPALVGLGDDDCVYFVHSFHVPLVDELHEWVLTTTSYGVDYVSAVQRGSVLATQFHPEKSSAVGLKILDNHLKAIAAKAFKPSPPPPLAEARVRPRTHPRKRVVACLDVRSNDSGDLIVTKGDSYNVREAAAAPEPAATGAAAAAAVAAAAAKGAVRNLGKPVALASRYYAEGADEITFLNITGFRDSPLEDLPMLALLVEASQTLFVPLCVGGGIRNYVDARGEKHSALQVAAAYFRAGADKVSIGSEVGARREADRAARLGMGGALGHAGAAARPAPRLLRHSVPRKCVVEARPERLR